LVKGVLVSVGGWLCWGVCYRQIRDTPTRIRGLAVFAKCLTVGLACRDQRRLTGSGN